MYVRWKTDNYGRVNAWLVECVRVDGRPRQRTIRYLSSIRGPVNYYGKIDTYRDKFWDTLRSNLNEAQLAGEIDKGGRVAIEKKIAKAVPHSNRKREAEWARLIEEVLKQRTAV
jgi:hypothetical protein